MLRFAIGFGFLLAATACSSSPDNGPIDFRVSGGFSGQGDGTAIHIEPDGISTRTSPTDGTVTEPLDRATLDALQGRIHDAQFPDLEPSYGCLGCGDAYVYQVTVELDGTSYQVSVDGGENTSPPLALGAVIDTLKQLAHSH